MFIFQKLVNDFLKKEQKTKILVSHNNYHIEGCFGEVIPLNNNTILKTLLYKGVGAVIIELIQTNGEILIADNDYLTLVRDLCNKYNTLFVLDVSSISPCRLGSEFFNYNKSLKPDVLIISKGLTNGLPFGAVITSDRIKPISRQEGKNTTLAYKQAAKFIDDFYNQNLAKIISSNAGYLERTLNGLA